MALRRNPPPNPSRRSYPLGRVKLHLDDIDDVCELLKDHCVAVEIRAGNAIATTADDLRDATHEELLTIVITGFRPDAILGKRSFVRVSLLPITSEVTPEEDTDAARELASDLARLLNERAMTKFMRRMFSLWLCSTFAATMVCIFVPAVPAAIRVIAYGSAVALAGETVLIAIGRAIPPLAPSGAVVVPERRGERRRTRREFAYWVTGVVISAFLGYVLTYWQIKATSK